jgi:hypothetical protein
MHVDPSYPVSDTIRSRYQLLVVLSAFTIGPCRPARARRGAHGATQGPPATHRGPRALLQDPSFDWARGAAWSSERTNAGVLAKQKGRWIRVDLHVCPHVSLAVVDESAELRTFSLELIGDMADCLASTHVFRLAAA